mgnify:CR=1 FL=1
MKCAARPNLHREDYIKKSKQALGKLQAIKKKFESREKIVKADLEKTSIILKKLGERFKWWGSLP